MSKVSVIRGKQKKGKLIFTDTTGRSVVLTHHTPPVELDEDFFLTERGRELQRDGHLEIVPTVSPKESKVETKAKVETEVKQPQPKVDVKTDVKTEVKTDVKAAEAKTVKAEVKNKSETKEATKEKK